MPRYFCVPSVYSADYGAKEKLLAVRDKDSTLHIFIVNYPTYFLIDISQGPTSPSVCIFQHGGLTPCAVIDLSSLIPLISVSSWTKGAWTIETVETKSMKGTISHVSACPHGLLAQCIRCGVHPSSISVHSTYNPQHCQLIMALKSTNNTVQHFYSLTQSTRF